MSNEKAPVGEKAGTDQKTELKPQPVTVCTRCGAVSYSTGMIGGQCAEVIAGKRCTGVIGSAPKVDWEECPACLATGTNNGKPCGQCYGTGWLYVGNKKH